MRASAAPRQKCRPAENETCSLALTRVMSKRFGVANTSGSRFAAARAVVTSMPFGSCCPATVVSRSAVRPVQHHRRVEAQDPRLRWTSPPVGPQRGQLLGVIVQQGHAVAEQVDRRLEAGRQDETSGGLEFALVQPAFFVADGDELAEQVVARFGPQPAEVMAQPLVKASQRTLDPGETVAS